MPGAAEPPAVRPLPPLPPPPAVERLLAEVGAPALSIEVLLHDLERDVGRGRRAEPSCPRVDADGHVAAALRGRWRPPPILCAT